MNSIFLIVREVRGPHGHGEPGEPYLSLHTDGEWFDLGEPSPALDSERKAENFRTSFDKYNSYKVKEIKLL